jgi:probable HAF family extracellular repeat protein
MKCFDRMFTLLSVSILLSSVALAQATLKFQVTDLGILIGNESIAYAINNQGQVVGDYWANSYSEQRCFFYSGGAWQDVAMARGATYCHASAINDAGQIAGQHASSSPGHPSYAFRLDPPNGLSDLLPVNGGQSGGAGISPSGAVVGSMYTPSATHAAKWDPSGLISDLGYQCPSCYSEAHATNGVNIVGLTQPYGVASFDAFWFGRGGLHRLPNLGGGYSQANAINANGDIVGDSRLSSGNTHATLWQGGNVFDLGVFSVNNTSSANGVSKDTWIVGWAAINSGTYRAFLRVPNPNCSDLRDLNNLLDSSGAGWILMNAFGINDNHQIVGWGYFTYGAPGAHAFVLTPNRYPLC